MLVLAWLENYKPVLSNLLQLWIASTGIKKIGAILAEHNKKARLALLKEQTRTITINEEGIISSSENAREFVSEKFLDSRYQTEKLEKIYD